MPSTMNHRHEDPHEDRHDDTEQIFVGVFQGSKQMRNYMHLVNAHETCNGTRFALPYPQRCERVGCVDVQHDVYTKVLPKISTAIGNYRREGTPVVVAALATTASRNECHNMWRQLRTANGGVAKPKDRNGVPGRIAGTLDCASLDQILTWVLDFAGDPRPLSRPAWPLDSWSSLPWRGCAHTHGGIGGAVDTVVDTIKSVAGYRWWAEHVLQPLHARSSASMNASTDGSDDNAILRYASLAHLQKQAAPDVAHMMDDLQHLYDGARNHVMTPQEAVTASLETWAGERNLELPKRTPAQLAEIADYLESLRRS
jgi:hypothetical protein